MFVQITKWLAGYKSVTYYYYYYLRQGGYNNNNMLLIYNLQAIL